MSGSSKVILNSHPQHGKFHAKPLTFSKWYGMVQQAKYSKWYTTFSCG